MSTFFPFEWDEVQKFVSATTGFNDHIFEKVEETDSTNSELLRRASSGDIRKYILVADHQSEGRGQFDRKWFDVPKKSLLMSYTWDFTEEQSKMFPATLIAGIAVSYSLAAFVHADIGDLWLKWPNDIMFQDRKLGGILIESIQTNRSSASTAIIGIGLNISDIPEIPEKEEASSLLPQIVTEASGISVPEIFCRIIYHWSILSKLFKHKAILVKKWEELAAPFWKKELEITAPAVGNNDEVFSAIPIGITEDGALKVRLANDSERLIISSKKIRIIR
ncbi:MAG: biotin--[acetyl-CoA-carboxylase] ligase [Candidatus Riflebacteria bacterium]|nr:biotin--[acetyl-CoA-carboxylase] ligase [Candidatus Riflebacteria bacterium]